MSQTYIFEHGAVGGHLGVIRVPLTAEQIAIVNEACLDYVLPADIVVAGIQALEAIAAAHALAALTDTEVSDMIREGRNIMAQADVAEVIA